MKKQYRVYYSNFEKDDFGTAYADSPQEARRLMWNSIKQEFDFKDVYGWRDFEEFKRKAKVIEL